VSSSGSVAGRHLHREISPAEDRIAVSYSAQNSKLETTCILALQILITVDLSGYAYDISKNWKYALCTTTTQRLG